MSACSPREVATAAQALRWMQEPVRTTDIFDAGFELVRHALLEAWTETHARDRVKVAPLLDLLTTLKVESETPVLTATVTLHSEWLWRRGHQRRD